MVILFFGKRGAGKTTAIGGLLRQEVQQPVFVFDLLGNYSEFGKTFQSARDAIAHYVWRCDNQKKHKPLIIQSAAIEEDIDLLSTALWKNNGGTLVLDEVDSIPYNKVKAFDFVVRYGRNKGIDIIAGCRRPAEVSKHITASADIFYCFGTHEPRDVDYFERVLGSIARRLPRLKRFHGIYVDFKTQTRGTFESVEGQILREE